MQKKTLLPLLLALALLSSACVKKAQVGGTHVGRGELFRTGTVAFDEFFEDVNALQKETKAINEEQTKALARIGTLLSLSDPKAGTVFVAVKEKARAFAEAKKTKVFFKVEGVDDQGRPQPGKQVTVTAAGGRGQPVPKDAQDLVAALDEASKAEGQIAERFLPLTDKAKRRTSEAEKLRAQVDAEFSSAAKREEVERELDEAKKVLVDVAQRCDEASVSATGFLRDTQQTFAAMSETKGKVKGKAAAKGGGKPGKPSSGAAAPGGSGGEFNP
jgi:hypothetical protein